MGNHPHGIVEPVMVQSQSCIAFHCPCGWSSDALRPSAPGTLRTICGQYHAHLNAVGYYPGPAADRLTLVSD